MALARCTVSLLPASPETTSLRNFAARIVLLQAASLVVLMGSRPHWRWLARIRLLVLFRSHLGAGSRVVSVLLVLKGLYFSVFVGVFWLGCHSFDVDLPLELAVAATPIILMAGAIPITPAGLGTQQAAMLFFFAPYGNEASILALGLTFPVALLLLRALLGLPYLKDLPRLRRAMAEQKAQA